MNLLKYVLIAGLALTSNFSLADIGGFYAGKGTATISNCLDPSDEGDNGSGSSVVTINIINESGSFSGKVLRNGTSVRGTMSVSDSGDMTASFSYDGGSGSLSGTVVDSSISSSFTAQDVTSEGVSDCFYQGEFSLLLSNENIKVNPEFIDFGTINVGDTSSSKSFVLSNQGKGECSDNHSVSFESPSDDNHFVFDESQSNSIRVCPGEQYSFPVTFKPLDDGEKKSEIKITLKDKTSREVELRGEGEIDWNAVIQLPESAIMLEPYDLSLTITNPSSNPEEVNVLMKRISDLAKLWELDEMNTSSCNGFELEQQSTISIPENSTGNYTCTITNRWNWFPPPKHHDLITELTKLEAGILIDIILKEGVLDKILGGTITALNAIIEILKYNEKQDFQNITYAINGDARATPKTIQVVVSDDKRAYRAESLLVGIGGGLLSSKAIILACNPLSPSFIITCPTTIAAGLSLIDAAYNLSLAAIDPQYDYDVVSNPENIIIPELEEIPDPDMRNLALASIEKATYSKAFFTAFVRYVGAMERGDGFSAAKQLSVAIQYLNSLQEKSSIIEENLRRLDELLPESTPTEVMIARQRFTESELPSVWYEIA